MQSIFFHLPGFSNNLNINLALVGILNKFSECFHDGIRIASFFGSFPNAIWNGGRCEFGQIDIPKFQDTIERINSLGIAIRYTFTNCLIKEEHLSDEYCNRLMDLCDNGKNEVLVNSPCLERYLRSNYPGYKYVLSSTALTRGFEAVNTACKYYDLVVADYRDVKEMAFLQEISSRNKVEIMVNESCVMGCKYRREHYELISRSQLTRTEMQAEKMCRYHDISLFKEAYIPIETLYNVLVPMGFINFKIRGREFSTEKLINEYMSFLVKPQFREKIRKEVYSAAEF